VSTTNVVLIVDDDSSTQKAVVRLLGLRGFDTEAFDSGEQLLAWADLHAAVCVVLDIHLPGLSGIQVRQRLAAADASLPVIFMTGNDSDATRRCALEAGCVAYLCKPFSSQTLATAVDKAVSLRRHTAA
jgi:FixJ family two-component response regulator